VKLELEVDDLLQTPQGMPCQDTPAGKQFFDIFVKAAAGSSAAWASTTKVSDDIRKGLKSKDLEKTTTWRDELTRRSEPVAAKAILSGKPEDLASAKAICEFQASFGFELGKKCSGLLSFMAARKL
jgi:hypothetical protein